MCHFITGIISGRITIEEINSIGNKFGLQFGETLLVGWAYPDENDINKIYIERTGPFVPPVYEWANMLLVSETTKQQLKQSGLKGIGFIKNLL